MEGIAEMNGQLTAHLVCTVLGCYDQLHLLGMTARSHLHCLNSCPHADSEHFLCVTTSQ